jgi:signal transduction histidine kinase
MSATQMLEGYRSGDFTPRDVVDEVIDALKNTDALCKVMTADMFASARLEADQAASFRPRARILKLLGDQLIASPRLAVFELVKNAYDADADDVRVRLENIGTADAKISVSDNGEGMTEDVIRNAWLVPADDHKG